MKKSLFEIVHGDGQETEIEKAICAAYWAGQSQMRGLITEQIKQRLDSLPGERYRHVAKRAALHICTKINGINENYLAGRGDSGAGESAEFLSWDFEIPTS